MARLDIIGSRAEAVSRAEGQRMTLQRGDSRWRRRRVLALQPTLHHRRARIRPRPGGTNHRVAATDSRCLLFLNRLQHHDVRL
eukprot:scaffold76946_cov59-Phaeocystis_antarctica.AAC.5